MVGDPKQELLRKAKEIKSDVVLVGARKMGTIKRFVFPINGQIKIQGRLTFFIIEHFWVVSVITLCTIVHVR